MLWSEHETATGDASWACASCHRPASLTPEAWRAQCEAQAATEAGQAAQEAADAPDPSTVLRDALSARQEATAELAKLEQAQVSARTLLVAAQTRFDKAEAALREQEAGAITRLAGSIMAGQPAPKAGARTWGARTALSEAEDAVAAARGAKQHIDGQVDEARRAVANAQDRARKAAVRVIAADELEDLVTTAVSSRCEYLEAIASLAWLLKNFAVPAGDARPAQLVAGANSAPAQWPEAQSAGSRLSERLTALLEGAP